MPEIENSLALCGQVASVEFSHEFMGEKFYRYVLEVPRQSETIDCIPAIISEKLLFNNEIVVGDYIHVDGQMRTRNVKGDTRKKLVIYAYANEANKMTEEEFNAVNDKNTVSVEGFIVKTPKLRETRKGRKIAETTLACNRQHNKSDYIPCIIWGKDASFAKNLVVSNKVEIKGRFQSREYPVKTDDLEITMATAYELSVQSINPITPQ